MSTSPSPLNICVFNFVVFFVDMSILLSNEIVKGRKFSAQQHALYCLENAGPLAITDLQETNKLIMVCQRAGMLPHATQSAVIPLPSVWNENEIFLLADYLANIK